MVVYGYARLVDYNRDFQLVPDILQAFEVEEGRVFTFHLRPGHKWSDGSPFTTEDFRYYWEDVANNPEISPAGPPVELLVDGEAPKVEILDETTVRYSWSKPNWRPAAGDRRPEPALHLSAEHLSEEVPREICRCGRDGGDDRGDRPAELGGSAQPQGQHVPQRQYRSCRRWSPGCWRPSRRPSASCSSAIPITTASTAKAGSCLISTASSSRSPTASWSRPRPPPARPIWRRAMCASTTSRCLKENEKRGNYRVRLWETAWGSQVALYPNLNANDPGWRQLLRDVRFRRALSIAVDRSEINQVIYLGLGVEAANTVLPQSPLFDAELSAMWSVYDPDGANALLDEIGLTQRNSSGVRLLPDGRPLEIIVVLFGPEPGGAGRARADPGTAGRRSASRCSTSRRSATPSATAYSLANASCRYGPAWRMRCRPPKCRPGSWRRSRRCSSCGRSGASMWRPRARPARRPTCRRPTSC